MKIPVPKGTGIFALVKKVFLTSSQTRSASLGSRLKKAACRCANNLRANCAQILHLRHVMCFARRTRRRAKRIHTLFRRARRNSTRFFDRLENFCAERHRNFKCATDKAESRFFLLSAFIIVLCADVCENNWYTEFFCNRPCCGRHGQGQRRQESSFTPDMRRPRSLLHMLSVMP